MVRKFSQNGKFSQNSKFSHNGKRSQNGKSDQNGKAHLGPNVSSSAHDCGCVVNGGGATVWQQYEYYYYYYYYYLYWYSIIFDVHSIVKYRIAGIFRGGKFSRKPLQLYYSNYSRAEFSRNAPSSAKN